MHTSYSVCMKWHCIQTKWHHTFLTFWIKKFLRKIMCITFWPSLAYNELLFLPCILLLFTVEDAAHILCNLQWLVCDSSKVNETLIYNSGCVCVISVISLLLVERKTFILHAWMGTCVWSWQTRLMFCVYGWMEDLYSI